MAARRLLIVMLVLLGISSVIAVVAPHPRKEAAERAEREKGATGATGATGGGAAEGAGAAGTAGGEADGDAGSRGGAAVAAASPGEAPLARNVTAGGRVERIEAGPGDRLVLTVNAADPTEVAIPGLGLTGFADPYAPASFDLRLPAEPGSFPVRNLGSGERAAVITTVPARD